MSLTFANKVTVGRILIVPFFISTVLYYSPQRDYLRFVALGFFLIAVVSDIVDGYIARTHKQKTTAGAILDPLADKFLLISSFICLYQIGQYLPVISFPMWLVVALISRDVSLLLGAMIIQLNTGKLDIIPNRWGKMTAFFQIICVLGVLLQIKMSMMVWSVTLCVTIVSGIIYIREGIKVLNVSGHTVNR